MPSLVGIQYRKYVYMTTHVLPLNITDALRLIITGNNTAKVPAV